MATNFKNDATRSRNWFSRFVQPALREFGFTNVCSAENRDSELEELLDNSCVDALARQDGETVAIASRIIQKKSYGGNYDVFSLRECRENGYKTELEKLQSAIKKNSLRPMWHVQTFVDKENDEATVAIVDTKQLVEFVTDNPKTLTTRDDTKFQIAHWNDLKSAGVKIKVTTIKAKKNKAISLSA